MNPKRSISLAKVAALSLIVVLVMIGWAQSPPPNNGPKHPNPNAAADMATVLNRGDVVHLPAPIKNVLAEMARRPHSALPTQAYAEADQPSQLFQYYLLDTKTFEPNAFTGLFPGINDKAMLTAVGPNGGLP